MSTLSQSITNLLSGISQQPDSRKRPGQVKDAVNAFPDFALGMLKRPGGKYVATLHQAPTSGKWFPILRDDNEKYIACFNDNRFQVWDLLDGDVRMVDMGNFAGQPVACDPAEVLTEANELNTEVNDTATELSECQTAESTLAKAIAGQAETISKFFEFEYNYDAGVVNETIKSGIIKDDGGEYLVKEDGAVVASQTTTLPTGWALGTERTSEHPLLAAKGYRIWEGHKTIAATHTDAQLTTAENDYDKTINSVSPDGKLQDFNTAETAEATARTNYNTDFNAVAISTAPVNSRRIINAGSGLTNGTSTNVATSGGGGSGLTVDIKVAGGKVVAANINALGSGYALDDVLTVSGFSGVELELATSAYLRDATADDIELLTLNDFTFVLNKKRVVRLRNKTSHATGLDSNRAQVVINIAANSVKYEVLLTPSGGSTTTFDHTAASSGASSDSIASALAADITADSNFTATQVGASVYITSSSAFTIETRGGGSESAIFAMADTIANTARLPLQSKNGYVVKVINAEDIAVDDMYVKFTTDGGGNFGTGQWEETVGPGLKYQFDELTLPHKLVRQSDGSFTYSPVDWNNRLVGDDETNKAPSFVDHELSAIFFYRNRMGFLSGQNVILSKAGDLFNFWNTSAQAATNDDPIDISAAGKRPVFLNYVQPTAVGLVMYSTNEQFLLTTDSDILAPSSAKVNTMSGYECDANVEAVNLGTTQAFLSKTPLYARLFELNDINADTPPLMTDATAVVPELIPESVDSLVASPALSIVSAGEVGKSTLYQYRFLNEGRDRRVVNSWYKWNLTGTLLQQFFDASTFYAVVRNGSDVYVQSFDMTQSSEQGFLTLPTGEKTDVCLDLFHINPHRTYTTSTNKTRVFLPYDTVSGKTFNVVVLGGYIGDTATESSQSVGAVLSPTIEGSAGARHVDITGDFRGRDIIIGYNYDMTIDLPKLYRFSTKDNQISNDDVSSLIIHRIKVKTGLSGPVDYKISITGLNDWTNTISVTQPNQYQLNNVNMQASSTHVVPIFQRNENLAIQIIGNTPFPVSLLGLDWEGKLNQRFYRRG